MGLCVCYDLRFVETARALALQGAEMILVPTAWVDGIRPGQVARERPRSQAEGAVLQANLNQTFIAVAISRVGKGLGHRVPRLLPAIVVAPAPARPWPTLTTVAQLALWLATIHLAQAQEQRRRVIRSSGRLTTAAWTLPDELKPAIVEAPSEAAAERESVNDALLLEGTLRA